MAANAGIRFRGRTIWLRPCRRGASRRGFDGVDRGAHRHGCHRYPGVLVRPPESEPPEPMAQPRPPEPASASGTRSTPRSPTGPQNSTTPQSPPPSPVLSPDPNATRPPAQTQASEERPASSQNESLDPAVTSGTRLGLFLIAALALVGAGIVVYAYRPGRSSPTRWKPAGWKSRSQPVSAPAPASLGTLRPADDTPAISLQRELLASREGLVVGRAASICHVEIPIPPCPGVTPGFVWPTE